MFFNPYSNGMMLKTAAINVMNAIHDGRPQMVAKQRRSRHGERGEASLFFTSQGEEQAEEEN